MTTTTSEIGRQRPTLGQAYSSRHNSLNFLRLVLALAVVIDHAYGLGGYGSLPEFHGTSIGTLAVYGFFGISGFLIAGSAERNSPGRYLWQRFLRIFPGFWVCLLVTAFIIGVVGWWIRPAEACGLSCYFHSHTGPYEYLIHNVLLPNPQINQYSISGSPTHVVIELVWNGSLWTLFYEFLSYLVLFALAIVGLIRHKVGTLIVAIATWALLAALTLTPSVNIKISVLHHSDLMYFLKFASVFMAAAVLYLYRERIRDSGWIALGCTVACFASLWLPNLVHGRPVNPLYWFTPSGLLIPLLAYPILWLGFHLPFQKVAVRNDYSYGIYIYSYPVSQLLAYTVVLHYGFVLYIFCCVAVTVPLAVASWLLIEKRALSLKKFDPRTLVRPTNPPEAPDDVRTSVNLGAASDQDSPEPLPSK